MAYKAYVTKIEKLRKHPKADKLQIADINGWDVIVGMDCKVGDTGLFFSTDTPGKIMPWFLSEYNLYRDKLKNSNTSVSGMFDDDGRVKSIKLRGERSDGFFMPLEVKKHHLSIGTSIDKIGDKVLCKKYINNEKEHAQQPRVAKKTKLGSNIGWLGKLLPNWLKNDEVELNRHFDTENLRHVISQIPIGAQLIITEKLHGTSARTGRVLAQTWKDKLLHRQQSYYVTGTRNTVVVDESRNYGKSGDTYRIEWHNRIKGRGLNVGETVYYEIVGYESGNKTIMPQHAHANGDKVIYSYGNIAGQSSAYVYRITQLVNGVVTETPFNEMVKRAYELGLSPVPFLQNTTYDGNKRLLVEYLLGVGEMKSSLASHIREGVVIEIIHPDWRGQRFVKLKSKTFCDLEGIMATDPNSFDPEDFN
jgi:hypothetical protein